MGFDLSELLKNVSDSGTGREQIEYIRLDLIDGDDQNFYELSEIEALANNIATVGLQQPLRVRPHPASEGRYMVVSGHRRRAALLLLAKEDPERWNEIACIVDQDVVSPALQQLRLIFGNSNTRKMSSAEQNEQAAQVEKLLYQLKEEGYEFPGRMRDHVAQVVQASKTKLAKLKMIRDNLAPCWQPRYKRNKIAEDVAYSLAQLPKEWQQCIYDVIGEEGYIHANYVKTYMERFQKIDKLKCKKRGRECACQNVEQKRRHTISLNSWTDFHCGKCCSSCPELISCKNACPVMADKVKQMKADNREARRQEKLAQEEKDRPQVEQIQALWMRFGYERERAKKSVKAVFEAQGRYYCKDDAKKFKELEDCTVKITPGTKLPYNYNCYLSEITRLIAVADLFGCSLDYLFCRTDVREMAQAAPAVTGEVSQSGTAHDATGMIPGNWYPTSIEPPLDVEIILIDKHGYVDFGKYIDSGTVYDRYCCTSWEDVRLWSLPPQEATAEILPVSSVTGPSPLEWRPGHEKPQNQLRALARFDMQDGYPPVEVTAYWRGQCWEHLDGLAIDGQCLGWFPLPPEVPKQNPALNKQCVTGLNPYGNCGSAACCTEPYTCCKDCPDPCNSGCGYLEDA